MKAFKRRVGWVAVVVAYALVLQSFFGAVAGTGVPGSGSADGFFVCSANSTSHQDGPGQPSNRLYDHHSCCV